MNLRDKSTQRVFFLSRLILIAGLVLAGACTKNKPKPSSQDKAAPPKERVVNLYIWGDYTSTAILDEFTRQTGIKVTVSNYSSNEELLAKLQAGAVGFDLAVPSDYMVTVMHKLDLIQNLDKARIPNTTNIDPRFLNRPYDPKNSVSLPYAWSITGIAVNRALYKEPVTSWRAIFDNPRAKGRISMLDDVREGLGAALKMNGASINSTNPAELTKAQATIIAAKPNIKAFNSMPGELLASSDVMIAQMYSGEAMVAARDSGKPIEFVIPEEGGTIAIDNVVLLKGASHEEEAYALMNYFFDIAVNTDLVIRTRSGPVVRGVRDRLPKDLQDNPTLFPKDAALSKCEMMHDLGAATMIWDRLWAEIKAASH